jgi:hypothetical protein
MFTRAIWRQQRERTLEYWELTDILWDCGIDIKFAKSFVTWADWEFSEGEIVLTYAYNVFHKLNAYVAQNSVELTGTDGKQIDDTVVLEKIDKYFSEHLPDISLIDIAN